MKSQRKSAGAKKGGEKRPTKEVPMATLGGQLPPSLQEKGSQKRAEGRGLEGNKKKEEIGQMGGASNH